MDECTVGHVYGIVHVSLWLLVNNTKVLVLFELMDYTSKGGLDRFFRFTRMRKSKP